MHLDLTAAEARSVAEARGVVTVWRAMEPQPVGVFKGQLKDLHVAWDKSIGYDVRLPPFQPGDVVPIREPWSSYFDSVEDGGIGGDVPIYEATFDEDWTDPAEVSWQPAESMPSWAIRQHARIVSCEPVQVDGIWGWGIGFTVSVS